LAFSEVNVLSHQVIWANHGLGMLCIGCGVDPFAAECAGMWAYGVGWTHSRRNVGLRATPCVQEGVEHILQSTGMCMQERRQLLTQHPDT